MNRTTSIIIVVLALILLIPVVAHLVIFGTLGFYLIGESREEPPQIVATSVGETDRESGIDPESESATAAKDTRKDAEAPSSETKKAGAQQESKPAPPKDPNVVTMFDGKTLGNWEPVQFGGEGEVFINEEGAMEFGFGAMMTGVKWKGEAPARSNYEITLDAKKIDGNDFFCGLTFPVQDSHASFIVGGWGGGIVGISSVDDLDASENETLNIEGFEDGVWHRIRVRVTDDKLQAWIGDKNMVDLELEDRKISLRPGDIELCVPVGIAAFTTRAAYKNIEWRNLTPEEIAASE